MKGARDDQTAGSASSPKTLTLEDLANTVHKSENELRNANRERFWQSQRLSEVAIAANSSGSRMDDAMAFLMRVDTEFGNRKETFDMFLHLMLEFHSQRLQIDEVIETVKELFQGHYGLIFGFSAFLPKDKKIKLALNPVNFGRAIEFVNSVKDRFRNEEHVYASFLETLNNYERDLHKPDSKLELTTEVCALLDDHPDLIEGFRSFVPN